jgi:hypothetical protein
VAKAKLAPKILVDDFHANLRRRLIEGAAQETRKVICGLNEETRERLIAEVYGRYEASGEADLGHWLLDQTTLDNLLIDFDVSDGEVRS